ncbi:MAG: hypothetical protein JWP13_313 [Candidatus Saccharibacteria bacterium]|nr:hypothetical protein [Candidatus Saccharibacteria bacterium]
MSNSLADILMSKNFDEPAESTAIKQYVLDKYRKSVAVTVREKDIVITAQGAAFTNALRMQWKQLQRAAQTDKRLVFKIA